MKSIVFLSSVLMITLLSGCAPMQWQKPGGTQAEFSQTRYECIQQSAHLYPPLMVPGPFGGYLVDGNQNNRNQAFNSCMAANGWYMHY